MKNLLTVASISLNLILILAMLFLTNKMGYLGRVFVVFNANYLELPTDTISSGEWWQAEVKYEVYLTQNQHYDVCLFGDSISSGLGNSLGNQTFNFALPGMSTISQIEQLKFLTAANVKCEKAIIALGTNDAGYRTMDNQFTQNLKQIIATVKQQMGATRVILLPAFYSTVEASHDPSMAGTIDRVERINELIRQVAASENVLLSNEGIQALYDGQALKGNLTGDGVHLNADGRKIYREALLKIIRSPDLPNGKKAS